jgi:predicted ABC-type ATPase
VSNSGYLKGRRLRVFAGPNGSGKTTIFKQIAETFDIGYYINADDLEVQLIHTKKIELTPFGLIDLQEHEFAHFQHNHSILQKARQSGFELNLAYSSTDNCIVDSNSTRSTYSYEAALIADFLRIKLIERGKKLTFETVMSHPSKLDILNKQSGMDIRSTFILSVHSRQILMLPGFYNGLGKAGMMYWKKKYVRDIRPHCNF